MKRRRQNSQRGCVRWFRNLKHRDDPSHGEYLYEIRQAGEVYLSEQMRVSASALAGVRLAADGRSKLEIDAALTDDGAVQRVSIRYASSLFKRTATYEAVDDNFRGSVSAVAGRNEIVIKLGRFRKVT